MPHPPQETAGMFHTITPLVYSPLSETSHSLPAPQNAPTQRGSIADQPVGRWTAPVSNTTLSTNSRRVQSYQNANATNALEREVSTNIPYQSRPLGVTVPGFTSQRSTGRGSGTSTNAFSAHASSSRGRVESRLGGIKQIKITILITPYCQVCTTHAPVSLYILIPQQSLPFPELNVHSTQGSLERHVPELKRQVIDLYPHTSPILFERSQRKNLVLEVTFGENGSASDHFTKIQNAITGHLQAHNIAIPSNPRGSDGVSKGMAIIDYSRRPAAGKPWAFQLAATSNTPGDAYWSTENLVKRFNKNRLVFNIQDETQKSRNILFMGAQ